MRPTDRAWRWSAVWSGIALVLLVVLALDSAFPLLDHHAVERGPWHAHVVIGGNGIEQERLLAQHRHGYEQPHGHVPLRRVPSPAATDDGGRALVIVVETFDGAGVSVLGILAKALLAVTLVSPLRFFLLGQVPLRETLPLREIPRPVPEPPPRHPFVLPVFSRSAFRVSRTFAE